MDNTVYSNAHLKKKSPTYYPEKKFSLCRAVLEELHSIALQLSFSHRNKKHFVVSLYLFLVTITINVPTNLWLQQLLLQIGRPQLLYLSRHACLSRCQGGSSSCNLCSLKDQRTFLEFLFVQFFLAKMEVMTSMSFTCWS